MRRSFCSIIPSEDVVSPLSSQLAKQIYKSSKRSIRSPELWSNFSKQVVSNSAYLSPRDVSMIIQSFARIEYKDEKMLSSIIPSILKHVSEFSVRELVTILSSFRKLELEKSRSVPSSCINLIVNELAIRSSEWTPIDVALIANSLSWFSIYDEFIWKKIERKTLQMVSEISPLGLSLIITSLANLGIRNERILGTISRAFTRPAMEAEPMKQESMATLINGFAKLDWNSSLLFEYIENELVQILSSPVGVSFFDTQSKILILHALFAHRYRYLDPSGLSEIQELIFTSLVESLAEAKDSLASDQMEKLRAVAATMNGRYPNMDALMKGWTNFFGPIGNTRKPRARLSRWEYEVFRILRDKMGVKSAIKKKICLSTVIMMQSEDDKKTPVVVNCLGPFQHYTESTKRTSSSWLLRELIRFDIGDNVKFIEIPFYIWNELRSDKDKIAYLMTRGREVANDERDTSSVS